MFVLIMLGIIASQIQLASNWFWGLYIAAWILKALKLIISIIGAGLVNVNLKDFKIDKK